MAKLSYSSAENRLTRYTLSDFNQTKKTSTRGTQVPVVPTSTTYTNPLPVGSANFAVPLTQPSTLAPPASPNIVPKNYSILNDPTYIGNLGPAAGQSWSGGVVRADGSMAGGSNVDPYLTIDQQAQAYADSVVKPPSDSGVSRDFNAENMAKEQAKQAFYAKLQADAVNQKADAERKYRQMLSTASPTSNPASPSTAFQSPAPAPIGNSLTDSVNSRLTERMNKITGTRQDFIEQKRAEGLTDAQIRDALAALPPDTFKKPQPAQAPVGPVPTPPVQPSPAPTQPTPTSQGSTSSTTDSGSTQTGGATQDSKETPTPVVDPSVKAQADYMRSAAMQEQNPMMRAAMLMQASQFEANGGFQQSVGYDQFSKSADAQSIASDFNVQQELLNRFDSWTKSQEDKQLSLMKDQYDRNERYNAQQQENIQNQLRFQEQKALRDTAEANKKAVDSATIRLALRGGSFSEGGNANIDDMRQKGEQALADLSKEFGFKHTDVALQFTQMHNQAYDAYTQNVLKTEDDFYSRISSLTVQGMANQTAKKNALATAWKERNAAIKEHNDTLSKGLMDAAKFVEDRTNKLRDDQRAQEQLGINMLDKLVDTYGNNVPPSLLETVKKYIPNIDIQDVMKRRTLAQMKKGAGGGLGGLTGFSFSQKTPTGKPQTLEQFIETKQKDFNMKMSGPASPQMRKEWEKEYQAKLAIDTANTAEQLMKEWTIKRAGAGNFPNLGTMKAVEADIHNAIKAGELDFARQILDGIGPRPVTAIAEKVTNTQQLVADLDGMENLLDEIEQNVGAFPTKGKLWTFINENIETTPEYARLRQYVDTNLAPYARGVSGDKGATSEPDVARAMSSLLDPNVDAPALRAALAQAKKRASMSSTLLLKNLRDGGYRVNALQESNDKFMNQYQQVPSPIPQSTQDWFNKY